MIYFQIVDCGFALDTNMTSRFHDRYLDVFRISKERYESLEDQINIHIVEKEIELPNDCKKVGISYLFQKNGKMYMVSPYGHCKYAVLFSTSDWKNGCIDVQVNPMVYEELGFGMNQLFSLIGMHSAFLNRDAMIVHASYIVTNKGAILFTAPSQTGKSTQADLWNRTVGAEIINGDRVAVRRKKDGWYAYGIPMCGSSDICKNQSTPIRAIVVLEQGKENKVLCMRGMEKYKALVLASAYHIWSLEELSLVNQIALQLMHDVDIIKLSCLPNEGAVWTLQNYLNEVSHECK